MKNVILLSLLMVVAVFGQDYQASTTPTINDKEMMSLQKITKLLNDAKTGGAPISVTVSTSGVTPATVTPTISTVTSSGSVAAGAKRLVFIFSGDYSGTLLGATFAGGVDNSITLDAGSGNQLNTVAYTVTTGSIRIVKVQ